MAARNPVTRFAKPKGFRNPSTVAFPESRLPQCSDLKNATVTSLGWRRRTRARRYSADGEPKGVTHDDEPPGSDVGSGSWTPRFPRSTADERPAKAIGPDQQRGRNRKEDDIKPTGSARDDLVGSLPERRVGVRSAGPVVKLGRALLLLAG